MHHALSRLPGLLLAAVVATSALLALPRTAAAQDDPPGRAGRLADFKGRVSWYDQERGEWAEAQRNRPLTSGDRISTADSGRAEVRVGSTVLRIGSRTEVELLRVEDDKLVFQLHTGQMALRVRSREVADEIELVTAEGRFAPQRAGHFRIDREDELTQASAWRGEMRVLGPNGFDIGSGESVEVVRDRRGGYAAVQQRRSLPPADAFADWVLAEDRRSERSASAQYVSPEMTGAEDLDEHGRWERHPEYGTVWFPTGVRVGWAPYRYGHWAWVRPWGWSWVDDAPWGFAPFHYGRWVSWRGQWGWVPGAYVARPVFAPALVGWVGGNNWSVSVNIGGGPIGAGVGWVPLAPREPYRPWYRVTPIYVERINPVPRWGWAHPPHQPPSYHQPPRPGHNHPPGHLPQVPTGPIMYGNQGVPNAVSVVGRDVLRHEQGRQRAPVMAAPVAVNTQPVVVPAQPAQPIAPQPPFQQPQAAPAQPAPLQAAPQAPQPRRGYDRGRDDDWHSTRDDQPAPRRERLQPAQPAQPVQPVQPMEQPAPQQQRPMPPQAAPVMRAPQQAQPQPQAAPIAGPVVRAERGGPDQDRKQRPDRPERQERPGREREMQR